MTNNVKIILSKRRKYLEHYYQKIKSDKSFRQIEKLYRDRKISDPSRDNHTQITSKPCDSQIIYLK